MKRQLINIVTIELADSQTHENHELVIEKNIPCSEQVSLQLNTGNYSILVHNESGFLVCSSMLQLEQTIDDGYGYVEGEY